MATVKKSMKKAAPKKAMAAPMQAPMQAPPMGGGPMMKKGGKMAKAQNGKEIAEFLAKRKAAAPATPKYDRNEAMSQMNAASKGYDAVKDKASRDSMSAAYEPTREAGMKSMGYSKNKPAGYKAGGKIAKAMKVVKAVKAVKKAIKSK